MAKNRSVEDYISSHPQWKQALMKLRKIVLETELEETVKWGMPTYTLNGKNVVGLGAFKSYVGIWFFNGVYLKDEHKKLINAQSGKTRGLRQWRFQSMDEIEPTVIKEYLNEAIEIQKAGKEIKPQRKRSLVIPDELAQALEKQPDFKKHFEQLTPAKQREYAEYISEAKRADTKRRRLEKIKPMILNNIGLNDKYKSGQ